MANSHGGERKGAGRKPKRVKYPNEVTAMETLLAGHQERAANDLIELAKGGRIRISRRVMKRKADIMKTVYEKVKGPRGGITMLKKQMPKYPKAKDDEMVCVEIVEEEMLPDRAAIEYIIDRISGRTGEMEPPEESNSDVTITEETRKKALENTNAWRKQSQQQLASIRNPLTGQTLSESESESGASLNPEDSTMDEF